MNQTVYQMRDYRQVKLYLDTINADLQAQFDQDGTYTIPYTDLKKGQKHLIFFGTSHVRDPDHPQFVQLTNAFNMIQPQVAFNEGGQVPPERRYTRSDSAITAAGETGLIKYLCDSIGIPLLNGDCEDNEEFAALKEMIPVEQIYLYMAVERYLNGYRLGHHPGISLEDGWRQKLIPYLRNAGLGLTPEQESIDTLKSLYVKYLHKPFSLDSLEEVYEYYLVNDGMLGDVGRATKIIRDKALLKKIEFALTQYDRVFVVFGASHGIAIEPALKQIMLKYE